MTEAFFDFDAARHEHERIAPEFQIGGERFRCLAVVPAGATFDLLNSTNIATYREWLRSCLRDDDGEGTGKKRTLSSLERFDALLYRRNDPVGHDDIIAVADKLATFYAGRPTVPSSDSSDGRPPIGQPSRVVSLSPGATRSA